MKAEDLYALILNRGLTPRIADDGTIALDGDDKGSLGGASRLLWQAVRFHEVELKRLIAAKWMPPHVGEVAHAGVAPEAVRSEEDKQFDWDAEKLVRDLYSLNYGIRWDRENKRLRIFPAVASPRFNSWWDRAKPLWDRIVKHLTVPDGGSLVLYFRHSSGGKTTRYRQNHDIYDGKKKDAKLISEAGTVQEFTTPEQQIRNCEGCVHPFEHEPMILYSAWKFPGEEYWRALWGRFETGDSGRSVWKPWGVQ